MSYCPGSEYTLFTHPFSLRDTNQERQSMSWRAWCDPYAPFFMLLRLSYGKHLVQLVQTTCYIPILHTSRYTFPACQSQNAVGWTMVLPDLPVHMRSSLVPVICLQYPSSRYSCTYLLSYLLVLPWLLDCIFTKPDLTIRNQVWTKHVLTWLFWQDSMNHDVNQEIES